MIREEYPTLISTHLTGTRLQLSVTKQRGQTFETTTNTSRILQQHHHHLMVFQRVNATTTTTTSHDESLPLRCVNTTATISTDYSLPFKQLFTTTNPFYSTTESSGDHTSISKKTVVTGHIPMVS